MFAGLVFWRRMPSVGWDRAEIEQMTDSNEERNAIADQRLSSWWLSEPDPCRHILYDIRNKEVILDRPSRSKKSFPDVIDPELPLFAQLIYRRENNLDRFKIMLWKEKERTIVEHEVVVEAEEYCPPKFPAIQSFVFSGERYVLFAACLDRLNAHVELLKLVMGSDQ